MGDQLKIKDAIVPVDKIRDASKELAGPMSGYVVTVTYEDDHDETTIECDDEDEAKRIVASLQDRLGAEELDY